MITSTETVKKFKLLSKRRICCPLTNQAANWNLIFVPHVLTGVQSAGWNENQQKKVQERKTFGFQMTWFEIVLYVSSFHLHLAMNKNSVLFFFWGGVFCCHSLNSRELGVDTATQSWNNHWCKCKWTIGCSNSGGEGVPKVLERLWKIVTYLNPQPWVQEETSIENGWM